MRKTVCAATIVAAAAVLLLAGCAARDPAPAQDPPAKGVAVRTVRLEPRDFTGYLRVTGTVLARSQINVVAEEGGILKEMRVDNGRSAQAGDALAILDSPLVVAARDQAAAAFKQTELDSATKQKLHDQKAISENEYLYSTYALESARAAYRLVQTRVDKLTLRTPIAGIVNRRYYDIGAYVTPMTPVFEVVDLARLRIRAGIAERFASDVSVGTPVEVTFDAFADITLRSTVSYVSRTINPQSRTFDVELETENPGLRITPAMVANLRIRYQSLQNRIVIPLDALLQGDQGWYVFIEDNRHAKRVPVKQLLVSESDVLVDGLQAGQNLVTVGQRSLSDGDALAVP